LDNSSLRSDVISSIKIRFAVTDLEKPDIEVGVEDKVIAEEFAALLAVQCSWTVARRLHPNNPHPPCAAQ